MTQKWSLRQAKKSDLLFVKKLYVDTLREYIEPLFGWDDVLQMKEVEKIFEPEKFQIVLDSSKEMIGIIVVIDHPTHVELCSMSIIPSVQGHGVGTEIIEIVLGKATVDQKEVRLDVLRTNNRAKALYSNVGFEVLGEHENHFEMIWRPCA